MLPCVVDQRDKWINRLDGTYVQNSSYLRLCWVWSVLAHRKPLHAYSRSCLDAGVKHCTTSNKLSFLSPPHGWWKGAALRLSIVKMIIRTAKHEPVYVSIIGREIQYMMQCNAMQSVCMHVSNLVSVPVPTLLFFFSNSRVIYAVLHMPCVALMKNRYKK